MDLEEKIIENLRKCPRFKGCSVNICPLDLEVNLRTYIKGENKCPFTIERRKKSERRYRILLPDVTLKVIPKKNLKMLNKRNLKRWYQVKDS